MDAYFAAKSSLFRPAFTRRAVVCADDSWGRRLLERLAGKPEVFARPYSLADAEGLELRPGGASFRWQGEPVSLRLAGRFNVANAIAAATAADEVGVAPSLVARGLTTARPVPGRFEAVDAGQPFTVLVDYAHKPGALEHALAAARELVGGGGRLVAVFGCGGDRDPAKRPLMGEVVARLADRGIVTSDNPRSEDPSAIIDEVLTGVPEGEALEVELDRRRAIELAVGAARDGDVVVIAGKGHETTQTIGDNVLPFDDREVARAALEARAAGQGRRR
jgi:UDP-N-acetylmuramoyl-L-alanyl-D-glutamate--2,6-diaminopimelate ligase